MRLTPFPQRFYKCYRTEHITPNELAGGNVKNEINDFPIDYFTSTSCNNTTTLQSHATVVKLKPLRLLPRNLSGLKYVRI
jgi:hypothetical protein